MATLVSGINVTNGTVITPSILNAPPTLTTGTVTPSDLTKGAPSWTDGGQGALTGGSPAGLITVPTGVVLPFAYSFTSSGAPAGWLICDGSFYSSTTYANLYALLGTNYGRGSGTFAVPDLRGYFIRGSGTNADGTAAGTFGSQVADMAGPHNHSVTDPGHSHGISDPQHQHTYQGRTGFTGGVVGGGGGLWYYQGGGGTPINDPYTYPATTSSSTGITVNPASTGITIANNSGTETRPRNIAMLYCIKT